MKVIIEFATSFSSLTLTCYKFVALKENTHTHSFQNHYSKHDQALFRIFPMLRLGCHTKGGNWGKGSPCKTKILNFPLLLDITPSPPSLPWLQTTYWKKKGISNSFQTNFTKNFACRLCFHTLFHTPFFISNLIKFQLTSLQLGLCGLCANQI